MNTTGRSGPGELFWEAVLDLDLRYFPRPWTRPAWEDTDWSTHLLLVRAEGEKAQAFALFSHLPDDETAHLLKILMIPEHRGRGETVLFWRDIAFELKARGASRVYLEVEESNGRACSFYRKLGFEVLRQVKSYYSDGSAAVTMELTL